MTASPSTIYRICSRCIMDTSDPEISFDSAGVCNHCHNFDRVIAPVWQPNEAGGQALEALVKRVKEECAHRDYDCIIGLSGGVDSSYLALVGKKLGLRMLAVHVDAGWNSELAVKNIEMIVTKLGIDLHTHVVNWEEVRDLQVAFFKAALANQDVPQDHAFFSALYAYAVKNGIRYVLSGSNYATESTMPRAWAYNAMDLRHLKAIHRQFGSGRLSTYPTVNIFQYYIYYPFIRRMKVLKPLNYLPYNKEEAIRTLQQELGWRYYGGKHFESRFTKFQQVYYRPVKFGYDERRAYLCSLILSEQLSREQALEQIAQPVYASDRDLKEDRAFVLKKLRLSEDEFNMIMRLPNRTYRDYPSNAALFGFKDRIKQWLRPTAAN